VRLVASLGRQPNSVPFVLGGGRRPVVPSHVVRVRGDPPSGFIPRPYMSSTGRRSSLYSPPVPATHDALVFLLGNVMTVFNAYEACLDELDAWRRYFSSGQ